jgi:hypothetical protein
MTAKTSKTAAKAKDAQAPAPAAGYKNSSKNVAVAPGSTDAEFAAAVARTFSQPETSAASVIEDWQNDTHDVNALATELGKQVEAVNGSALRRAEGLLIAQAHTLDHILANLARRAIGKQYLPQWEAYMRMAMKAQNQCHMTLETLASIKNPPLVFAREADINNGGQQQVNNGSAAPMPEQPSHAAERAIEPGKLLEAANGERMDFGTKGKTSRVHPRMATMGAIKRTKDRGRSSRGGAQRLDGWNAAGAARAGPGAGRAARRPGCLLGAADYLWSDDMLCEGLGDRHRKLLGHVLFHDRSGRCLPENADGLLVRVT